MLQRPKLTKRCKSAFIFSYYEYFYQFDDNQLPQAMSKVLIINHQFLDSFFNRDSAISNQILLAVLNINERKVEFTTDYDMNGIYTGFLSSTTNLAIIRLASPIAMQLCLINFDGYTSEVVRFLSQFCRILREKKELRQLKLITTSNPDTLILDELGEKITSLKTSSINYPFYKKKMVMDSLCLYIYNNMASYSQILRAPARHIEIQQSNDNSNHLLDLDKCLPFHFNPHIEELTVQIDFDLSRLDVNFEPFEDADWSVKCYPRYKRILEGLRKINQKIKLRVSMYSKVHYNLKTLADLIESYHRLINNINLFIDLCGDIEVVITKITTHNRIFSTNVDSLSVYQALEQFGMKVVDSKMCGKVECRGKEFILEHNCEFV